MTMDDLERRKQNIVTEPVIKNFNEGRSMLSAE